MTLYTKLNPDECISRLRRNVDSTRSCSPQKNYAARFKKNRFCIWNVYSSQMPRHLGICTPALYGRILEDDKTSGSIVSGYFGLRPLALAPAIVCFVALAMPLVIYITSAPAERCDDIKAMAPYGLPIIVLIIWIVGGWWLDRAAMIAFLERILNAERK